MKTRTRIAAVAAAAVALLAPTSVVGTPAAAAGGTDTVTVQVRGEQPAGGSTHLAGIPVTLYDATTGAVAAPAEPTAEDGRVVFDELAHGRYTARATDPSGARASTYSVVTTVSEAQPSASTSILMPLDRSSWGTLTGRVTRGGAPNTCGHLDIYPATATTEAPGAAVVRTYLDSDGSWSVAVPAGSYKVRAEGTCEQVAALWAPNATDASSAATYAVAARGVTSVPTVDLPAPAPAPARGTITGRVTDAAGVGVGGVYVSTCSFWCGSATTASDGTYTIKPLAAHSSYRLNFNDGPGDYVDTFRSGIAVTDGQTTTVDVTLENAPVPEFGLRGQVTDDAGRPVPEVEVTVFDLYGHQIGDDLTTRRNGYFHLDSAEVPPGRYRLRFRKYGEHVPTWSGGASSYDRAAAVTVPVTGLATAAPTRLVRTGGLAGRITVPPVAGTEDMETWVQVYDAEGDPIDAFLPRRLAATAMSRSTEAFEIDELTPGTYYVAAYAARYDQDSDRVFPFIRQFWRGAYTLESATPVVVRPGVRTAGLNFAVSRTLTAVARPSISGKAAVGKTLTARPGTWSRRSNLSFAYTWKRGGRVVGRAATYRVAKADAGTSLTLTVTATDRRGEYVAGSASSTAVKVAKPPRRKGRGR